MYVQVLIVHVIIDMHLMYPFDVKKIKFQLQAHFNPYIFEMWGEPKNIFSRCYASYSVHSYDSIQPFLYICQNIHNIALTERLDYIYFPRNPISLWGSLLLHHVTYDSIISVNRPFTEIVLRHPIVWYNGHFFSQTPTYVLGWFLCL